MQLHNDFSKEDLRWFDSNWECWVCGQNHINCFHHIMGRGYGDSKCESSILNASPMNNFNCHLPNHAELRKEENQKVLLQKTIKYLIRIGYKFSDKDNEFIIKYKKFYD